MNSPDANPGTPVRVGVLGGTGYTGQELLRRLAGHDGVEVVFATSRSSAGRPSLIPGLSLITPEDAPVGDVEVVFLCLPHGDAAEWAARLRDGPRVIDLTADHRPGSGREDGAVYGLAERNADALREARLVANPGCYPTGVLLSLLPLVDDGLVETGRLTAVSAASGTTGAGRTPRTDLLFAEVAGNFRAYGEGNRHRHLKEMRALLPELSLLFQPHLLPVARGILETIVVPVRGGVGPAEVRASWARAYADSPAIQVLDTGLPDLALVVGSDRLALGVSEVEGVAPPVVTVVAALDNLGKGAAGQAVQNLNLMYGWPVGRGLRC